MKHSVKHRINPYVFLAPFLLVFGLLIGTGIAYAIANATYKASTTKHGTPFTASDLDMMESRPPYVTNTTGGDVPQPLMRLLASDYPQRPCKQFTEGSFGVTVLALSEDASQALVGLTCGSVGLQRAIFLSKDGQWIKLGAPTVTYNHEATDVVFSTALDVPACQVVTQYSLSPAVAPICYDGSPEAPSRYVTR